MQREKSHRVKTKKGLTTMKTKLQSRKKNTNWERGQGVFAEKRKIEPVRAKKVKLDLEVKKSEPKLMKFLVRRNLVKTREMSAYRTLS